MAEPIVQHETPSFASKLLHWTQKLVASAGRPLFAVLIALFVSGILIMFTSPGTLVDRFSSMLTAFQFMYTGSFGDIQSASFSLVWVTSLIFAGISVALAFRAGLFNIGAAGQLAVGTVIAGAIGLKFSSLPGPLLITVMIIGSALASGLWGSIVGFLKAWRGAHEVVTTIMLNWIAFFVAAYLINDGPLKAPRMPQQSLPLPPQATLPSIATFYNQTLGQFLPAIQYPTLYRVDVSFFFALIALLLYWFLTARTTFGYELRVLGQNLKAARYAGISVKWNTVAVMALSGAFAGLAGAFHLMGQVPYQLYGTAFSGDQTGFNAIGVALLGRTTPLGILLSALLFGGLQQAAQSMEMFAHIPGDLVSIIQALVLFSVAAEFLPALQRVMPKWLRRNRRSALAPNVTEVSTIEQDEPLPAVDTEIHTALDAGEPAASAASQEE
ncbi:ABC transporter permease [Tengunoibacter tsumagoiensis]|uniref:ABC transporter permease n=1 Tax=Tengunoibacter tsumagoiensis TaxID=2014871 RepID=A0A402A9S2_9CHLR|nr:ABC transporter permease [Tengunoibacter tsumagoiensis]GCE15890.1 ABC transporter permease [Tengunoibacter tsumagoiensis]